MGNKDKDFLEELEKWDVVMLMETWMDERGWDRIRRNLPRGYKWKGQVTKRKSKKGRAYGGMLMRIREEITVGGRRQNGLRDKNRGGKMENYRDIRKWRYGEETRKAKGLDRGEGRRGKNFN